MLFAFFLLDSATTMRGFAVSCVLLALATAAAAQGISRDNDGQSAAGTQRALLQASASTTATSTAWTELWVPCLVAAHAFALFWLLKAVFHDKWHRVSARAQPAKPGDLEADRQQDATGHTIQAAPAALEWQGLSCSYRSHGTSKTVLQDVWGTALPGQMQALMGPSGAGKSTLMDMLAMRKSLGHMEGRLLVDGQPATASFIQHTSYVPQEDTFIPTMTSQETLAFCAGVSLGYGWSRAGRRARVQQVLQAVGLNHAQHTQVGGVLPGGLSLRGLSGGERRRLSIAAGLLGAPSVIFLDEPTSGLDSFAALSVMGYLQDIAVGNKQTVIATIHQPRNAIWEMFDTVSLLACGRLIFHGPCADMLPWFNSLGYTYTPHSGSEADWVLDLVATGFDKPAHLFGNTLRTKADVAAAADKFSARHTKLDKNADSSPILAKMTSLSSLDSEPDSTCRPGCWQWDKMTARRFSSTPSYGATWPRQFWALIRRELANMTRNPFDVAARVLTFTYVALLAGILAYNANFSSLTGLQSQGNYIYGGVMMSMLLPYISISLYTNDKRIYLADASAKRYSPSAYYAAKVVATLPFNIVCTVVYAGVSYGMAGLQPVAAAFGRYAAVLTVFHLIACQVLHLCAVAMPNYDTTFATSVVWTTVQQLYCGFFIQFSVARMQWATQLRWVTASYYALEALMVSQYSGLLLDCSAGLPAEQVDAVTGSLVNATTFQQAMLQQLKQPQPGCLMKADAWLPLLGYSRPFGVSMAILLGYLAVLHGLTFAALVAVAKRERR